MAVPLATRKPIDQITVADLIDFPIWEFCLDEEGVDDMDETWVRPVAAAAVPADEAYSLSVAATFETASGLRVDGLIGVSTAGEVEIEHPVLLFDGKYLYVPRIDMSQSHRERAAIADALGTSPVFPLRYRLNVLLEGEATHREGTVA